MLFQSWLLTILVPLALGAPVFREPSPPTLTIMDSMANATSPEKFAESRKKIVLASKGRLQGSASSEYSTLGNGVGHKGKTTSEGEEKGSQLLDEYPTFGNGSSLNGTAGDTSQEPNKMGLNRANKMATYRKGIANMVRSDTIVSDIGAVGGTLDGTLEESPGGKLGGTSSRGSGGNTAKKNVAIGNKVITIDTTITGSDSGISSADETGNGETNTGQQGTTPGTRTTSANTSMVRGTNTPSSNVGTTFSSSKHK